MAAARLMNMDFSHGTSRSPYAAETLLRNSRVRARCALNVNRVSTVVAPFAGSFVSFPAISRPCQSTATRSNSKGVVDRFGTGSIVHQAGKFADGLVALCMSRGLRAGYLGISGICPTELMCASSKRMMVRAVSSSTNNDNVHMTGDVSIELSRWAASAQVHPSAVVDASAILGQNVVVGPFCTVGPQVVLGDGCALGPGAHVIGRTTLGAGCRLLAGAVVGSDDPGSTVLGDGNVVGHYALVGVKCQDLKYKNGEECFLEIGNNNDIREAAQIHRSSAADLVTRLGSGNLIMGGCHIAHDCVVGSRNIMANNTLLAGHVQVGDGAVFGGAVAVCPFCEVGSFAFLAGGSMVEGDVPACMRGKGDRAQLQGVNFEGLKRNGYTAEQIKATQRACRELFKDGIGKGGAAGFDALAVRSEDMLESFAYGAWKATLAGPSVPCTPQDLANSKGTESDFVSPAALLLGSILRTKTRDRAPGPCRWRSALASELADDV